MTDDWSIGGTPTDAELELLKETYPDPQPGDEYLDEELATLINITPDNRRFFTVMKRWHKYLMRQKNQLLGRMRMRGYKVLNPAERLEFSIDKAKSAERLENKALAVLGTTDSSKLERADQKRYEHQLLYLTRRRQYAMESAKRMRMLAPNPIKPK